MAKKQPQQPAPPEPDAKPKRYSVTLDPGLTRKIGALAKLLDMSVPDYVNNRLPPLVEKELREVIDDMGLGSEG